LTSLASTSSAISSGIDSDVKIEGKAKKTSFSSITLVGAGFRKGISGGIEAVSLNTQEALPISYSTSSTITGSKSKKATTSANTATTAIVPTDGVYAAPMITNPVASVIEKGLIQDSKAAPIGAECTKASTDHSITEISSKTLVSESSSTTFSGNVVSADSKTATASVETSGFGNGVASGKISTTESTETTQTKISSLKQPVASFSVVSSEYTETDSLSYTSSAEIVGVQGPSESFTTSISKKKSVNAFGLQPRSLIPASKQNAEAEIIRANGETEVIATVESKPTCEIVEIVPNISAGQIDGALSWPTTGTPLTSTHSLSKKERTFPASLGRINPEAASVSTSVRATAETASSRASSNAASMSSSTTVSTTKAVEAYIRPLQNPLELSISENEVVTEKSKAEIQIESTDTAVQIDND